MVAQGRKSKGCTNWVFWVFAYFPFFTPSKVGHDVDEAHDGEHRGLFERNRLIRNLSEVVRLPGTPNLRELAEEREENEGREGDLYTGGKRTT
jgi:hypothetical protein